MVSALSSLKGLGGTQSHLLSMLYLLGEDLSMKFQEQKIWINIEAAACTEGKFAFEKELRASFHLAFVIADSTRQ